MSKLKLIIGVTGPSLHSDKVHEMVESYFNARIYYIVNNNENDLRTIAKECDSIVFSGGSDLFLPGMGKSLIHDSGLTKSDYRRDKRERILIDEMVRQNKPALYICRGLQIGLTHFGFKLIPNLNGSIVHSPGEIKVNHEAGEFMHFLECEDKFKDKYFDVEGCNSYHHMGILAEPKSKNGIDVVATASTSPNPQYNQKIVEIAESEKHRFVFCAFHPELDYRYENVASNKVLERFKQFLD